MANITNNGNGIFRIRVFIGEDEKGKKIFKSTNYKPKGRTQKQIEKEVQQYALDFEKRVLSGDYLSGEELKLNEFVKTWLDVYAPKQLTPSEIEHYKETLNRIFIPVLGNKKLSSINAVMLQAIITDLENKGLQPATIRRYFNCISSVLGRAYKANIIHENPCGRLLFPKIDNDPNKIQFFDKDQAIRFLQALDQSFTVHYPEKIRKNGRIIPGHDEQITISKQFKAFFTLAIYSGCRRGEMIALTWNDIDFDKCILSITKATTSTKADGQYLKDPKTKAGIRSLMLPISCIDVLKEWKEEQKKQCQLMGTYWKGYRGKDYDNNFIFIQDDGQQMHLSTPTHKFREILNYYNASVTDPADKLPLIKLHDLRHTSASLMIASGFVDVETIARRMGHSDVKMTLNRYGHALPSQDEKAAFALASLLSAPAAGPKDEPDQIALITEDDQKEPVNASSWA